MGGKTIYYGKPYAPVYQAALAKARAHGAALRPLAIGDGLETDIRGANGVGWDAIFIASGVHGAEIAEAGAGRGAAALAALFADKNVHARGLMDRLVW